MRKVSWRLCQLPIHPRWWIHLWQRDSGQALVEFALVLPLFVLIITGIIDFGQLFMTELTLQAAARDGARYASVGDSDTEVQQAVVTDASSLQSANLSVQITPSGGNRVSGDPVSVSVTYPFRFDPPLSVFISGPIVLQSTTTMRVE